MAQQTFALMTTKGRAKEAAALASSKSINISHIAIGSGETVPSGGETKLYREVLRKAISGNGLVAGSENTAYFDIFLSATEGPFTIREAGLLDDEGDLIAIAYYDPPINKPVPTSGQTVEGIIRIEVAFSNIANITIKVDPSLNVPLQRLTTTPWVPVKAIDLATPPTNPNIGDSYIIGSNSTGVWAAQAGKLTEFTQAGWAIIATPDGHGVGLPDGRVFTKVNGQYIELLASQNYVANYRIPSRQLLNPPFVAVKAIDISAPPVQLAIGDTYLVPTNATGLWSGKGGQLAEWVGANWIFTLTPNGHSIGLPDGRVFIKVNGQYIEKIALDSQSCKWNYAEAQGTANELTATLNPAPARYYDGMMVVITPKSTTSSKTPSINLNELGARNIVNPDGSVLAVGALKANTKILLVFDAKLNSFCVLTSEKQPGQAIAFAASGYRWTSAAQNVLTKAIVGTTKRFDTHDAYNASTGIFTCPFEAVYTFNFSWWFEDINHGTWVYIAVNGEMIAESSSNSRGRVLSVSITTRLKKGDTVETYIRQGATGAMNWIENPGVYYTTLSGVAIGI
ncbi:phage tail protein [Bartonella sp. HY038]|uniref:phage tail-collar fiber domain-containing protein n=1 Tax=Bartonella sp. HY038 TaxID=2759660 RepID=UPI0015FC2D1D|nr:phage tail protein [Bartonella sp. HY038]